MNTYVAFLRAVNVGGTGKLKMDVLKAMCTEIGFENVATYVASGNVVFRTSLSIGESEKKLADKLETFAGKAVGVTLRTVSELNELVANAPFGDKPGNQVIALLLSEDPSENFSENAKNQSSEIVQAGDRAIYIYYPDGQGVSRFTLPEMKSGTARNMNTLSKMLDMAQSVTDRR